MNFYHNGRTFEYRDINDSKFLEILQKAFSFSMHGQSCNVEIFYSLYRNIEYIITHKIPGDFVECGVWAGGMSALAAMAFTAFGDQSRTLYLYDTYEGMPPPTSEDGAAVAHTYALRTQTGEPWVKIDIDTVRDVMISTGYPMDRIRFVKGMVEQTIPGDAPEQIAILRLDTDFYESTRHELEHLYPRLSRGGVLIIDDYGLFPGARKATDEYFSSTREPMLLNRVNESVRVGVRTTESSSR